MTRDLCPLPFFPFPLPLLHSSGTAKIMFFSGFKGEMAPCFLIFACLTMKRSSAGSSFSSSKCSCNWSLSSVRSARKSMLSHHAAFVWIECRCPGIRFASGSQSRFQDPKVRNGVGFRRLSSGFTRNPSWCAHMRRESHWEVDLATAYVACFQPRGPILPVQ